MDDVFATARPRDSRPGDLVAQLVVVCQANIARSPLGMALLEHEAQERRGLATPVWVRSAGVQALEGNAAAAESARQAERLGVDLSRHRAAQLTAADVEACDLVLTMTESQRQWAVRQHPAAVGWVFTLPELARLCRAMKPMADDQARERIRLAARLANAARPFVPRPDGPEDVEDPYGGPREGYQRMADEVHELVREVADTLFGPVRTR